MAHRYAECLTDYLSGPREGGLESAYNLGRLGISLGLGLLEVAIIHRAALEELLRGAKDVEASQAMAAQASDFLAECLASFEIVHRGYRESAIEMRRLNDALKQRATELAAAKELIENLSRARTAFLAEASQRLAGTLDFNATLQVVVNLPVPAIADWCAVDLAGEAGTAHRAAISHRPRLASGQTPSELPGPVPEAAAAVEHVIRGGVAEIVGGDETSSNAGQAVVIPLAARGRTIGALTLASTGTRRYSGEELLVCEEFGRRASMALDNAALYREAQQAVKVRDDFLSIASHELKTPLTPLTLRLQLAARRLRQGLPVDLPALESALRHVQRLAGLVNDLLDISRIEAGKIELRRAPLRLEPLTRELVSTFAQSVPDRVIEFDPGPSPAVLGDRARIEQVVTNLIDNAIKYSPAGGTVTVKLAQDGGDALLSVRDQGIGIPEAQKKRLFQRFFRAGNAREGFYGLGLGLFICRDIIERHGGRIWVESEEGKGSTFFVALPVSELPVPGSGGEHG